MSGDVKPDEYPTTGVNYAGIFKKLFEDLFNALFFFFRLAETREESFLDQIPPQGT